LTLHGIRYALAGIPYDPPSMMKKGPPLAGLLHFVHSRPKKTTSSRLITEIEMNPKRIRSLNRSPAPKTSVRLPEDVTLWLQRKAQYHVTSMTAEITRAVRSQMAAECRERAGSAAQQ
jgi:hypothetical protein